MKYCDRCGTQNGKDMMFCQGCGKPLMKNARQQSQTMAQQETAMQEKKAARFQKIGYGLLAGMYTLYLALDILLFASGIGAELGIFYGLFVVLVLPGWGYLHIFRTDLAFKLEHIFSIRDLDKAEPSDFYEISSKIGGVLLWALGIGMLAGPMIFGL